MALSMEEERILAEIEQELERSEPVLAACLTMFSRPGRAGLLRVPGARRRRRPWVLTAASVAAVVMLTVLPVVIYAMVALRAPQGQPPSHPAASSTPHAQHPVMSPPRQR